MKQRLALLITGLFTIWLVGCAGRVYKDDVVAMIQRGVTTESQLVTWFGPASGRTLYSDGAQLLIWDFSGSPPGKLEVRLDPDGKVIAYSGADHANY